MGRPGSCCGIFDAEGILENTSYGEGRRRGRRHLGSGQTPCGFLCIERVGCMEGCGGGVGARMEVDSLIRRVSLKLFLRNSLIARWQFSAGVRWHKRDSVCEDHDLF